MIEAWGLDFHHMEVDEAEGDHVGWWLEMQVELSLPQPPRKTQDESEEQEMDKVDKGDAEPPSEEPPEAPKGLCPEGFRLCKRCGPEVGPKPLAAFNRHSGFTDKRDNRCKECRREIRLEKMGQKPPSAEEEAGQEVERRRLDPDARLCANDSRCIAYDPNAPFGQPVILDAANPGPLCRGSAVNALLEDILALPHTRQWSSACGKWMYPTQEHALEAMGQIHERRNGRGKRKRRERSMYSCPTCGGVYLTSRVELKEEKG